MSDETITLITSYGVKVVGAVVGLWVATIVAKAAQRVTHKQLEKSGKLDDTLTLFFAKSARYTVLLVAVIAILGIFGIQTASFVAIIGAAGLAIGLAFQGSLSNFAAGVMLLAFRPFKVGDRISVAGETGEVNEIGLFVTTLDTLDNRRLIIPNSSIFGSTIENQTFHPLRRCDVGVGVDYGADLDKTREVLFAAGERVSGRDPSKKPEIVLTGLGDSSVNWDVRIWCVPTDYLPVLEATQLEIKAALDSANIGIPYPTVDVNLSGSSSAAPSAT